MLIALTGATGFVGSNTLGKLLDAGHRVRALVRPGRDAAGLQDLGVEVCRGRMAEEAALRALVEGTDVVIHTAYDNVVRDAAHQLDHWRSNVLGSLMLLDLSRLCGVQQFICTVSTYILCSDVEKTKDISSEPKDESSPWVSAWDTYVTHNVVLESACEAYNTQFDMNTTRFRCAWIYGVHPKLEQTVWRDILETVRAGKRYESTFGCNVVAVQDVAGALAAAVGNAKAYKQVFNLSDRFVYNVEVARLAREVAGSAAEIVEHEMPRPPAIRSDKVNALGIDLHRGDDGIREYLARLNTLI